MKPHALTTATLLASALSVALAAAASPPSPVKPAPTSQHPLLVARDAQTPIQVQSVAVTTEVDGGLARTRIEMTFHNPNSRRLEGELQFPLQPGQQVSGFALDVDGHMRAAVPVEKAKGQEVFEAVERRGIDPGLLEQTAGNQFRLRIYPIPANGERHVRIDIDQSLDRVGGSRQLRLPLDFASGVGRFQVHVIARGQGTPEVVGGFGDALFARDGDGWTATVDGDSVAARKGLALAFAASSTPQVFVQDVDGQRYFHAEVPVPGAATPRTLPHVVGLLWDSSASARDRDVAGELAVLERYFAAVRNAQVRLTRLRDVPEATRSFVVRNGDWSALKKELQATVYDGASALADWTPEADVQDYLLVSDGFSNYGTGREMPALSARQRLYALDSAGAHADAARLRAWADARGGRLVAWQGNMGVAGAARALLLDGPRLATVESQGASAVVAASRDPESGYLRIAGKLDGPQATITLHLDDHGREYKVSIRVAGGTPTGTQVAALWAGYRIAALESEPDLHQAEIHRLGSDFGLVTSQTSLIVLENPADYVRYDIAPPRELRAQVANLVAAGTAAQASAKRRQIDDVAREFAAKLAWWEKPWPKGAPPQAEFAKKAEGGRERSADGQARGLMAHAVMSPPPPPRSAPMPMPIAANAAPAMEAPRPMAAAPRSVDSVTATGSRVRRVDQETASPVLVLDRKANPLTVGSIVDEEEAKSGATNPDIGIAMHAWRTDAPYARRLHAAPASQAYAIYLDERGSHGDSSAFYLDVADVLVERGQRDLALRVLSNLAEMNLENRQLLRVLGYRLLEAHRAAQAVRVFEHVSRLAPNEPQSWRDLGLAQEADGHDQEAIDDLYKVVSGTWDGRFPSIDLIALDEMDAIIARAKRPLDTHAIDPRLLRNLPLDLRVVLGWDSDDTDIDLWVTDPNGEKTYYGSPNSYQGGWLSHDCTQGYGPEEFILRHAKPGKYKVEANFFGDHSQLITGPTTVQLHLFTGFGTPRQKDQSVAMRLKDAKDTVLVGEFDVK